MVTRSSTTILMLLLAGSALASADNSLSLDEAVALAAAAAPQLIATRAALDAAKAQQISAGRLPDPELVAGVDNLPINTVDRFSLTRDFITMRKLGLMQSIPNSHKRRSARELAAAQVGIAEADAVETRLAVARMVTEAWVGTYAAEWSVQYLQPLRAELTLQAAATRAAVASGRANAADALTAQAAVVELEDRLLASAQDARAARAELIRWAGNAGERPLSAPPTFADLPAPAAELLASTHHHASLLTFDAKIAAARSEVDVALAEKHPDWSTELTYAKRGPGYSDMTSLEFRMSLPLFSGERQDPKISASRALLTQLTAERQVELLMHAAETRTALATWESARDRIALYERERLPLARQRSQLALAAFAAGGSDLRQTLASHADEIELQRSYAELLLTLGRSWAYLRYLQPEGVAP